MKIIEGGICAVKGVKAFGIKEGKNGLAIITGEGTAAGVFTKNKIKAAPVLITQEHLKRGKGRISAIAINSGSANAYTGEQGLQDAREMAKIVAEKLGMEEQSIALASTGVIGKPLILDWIKVNLDRVIQGLTSDQSGSEAAARAIMTTDTKLKQIAVDIDGVRIAGIAKGAGMIEPNLATMLAFIYTDAAFPAKILKTCLRKAVDKSFNMIVVDGDTSTNDTVILAATGKAGKIGLRRFQPALEFVCIELAKMIVKDGEGATKFIEVNITSARATQDAKRAAKAIVRSPLVKTAFFGADPNWGRIICAIGYSNARLNPKKIKLKLSDRGNEVTLVDRGRVYNELLDKAKQIMLNSEVVVSIDLGLGRASATAWGCDLSYDYITINGKYTT
ncbi:MAG: bifunctional ornithine acetyltransferase/N-acetylglutamate synthase [Methanocellales archaeon]